MLEMSRLDPVPDAHTLHIVHPRGVPFESLIASAASLLDVPLVPYAEWLSRLSEAHKSHQSLSAAELEKAQAANPALRLFGFFQSARIGPEWEPLSVARLDTARAVCVSRVLAKGAKQLGEENVRKWISEWRAAGFLPRQVDEVVPRTEQTAIRVSAQDAATVVLATLSKPELDASTVLKGAAVVLMASRFGFLVVALGTLQLLSSSF